MPYLKSLITGSRPMHLVPVKNVIEALECLSFYKSPLMAEVYNISSDHDPLNTYREVERIIARQASLDYRPPNINLPKGALSVLLSLIGRKDNNIKTVYNSEKIKSLGYLQVDSLEESIESFVSLYAKIKN